MGSLLFFRRGVVLALAAPAALALSTGVAHAHYTYVYHGNDLGSVSSDHRAVTTCDRENDGHAVYTEALLANGSKYNIWDSYDSSCSTRYGLPSNVRTFRVCEQSAGCTSWESVAQ